MQLEMHINSLSNEIFAKIFYWTCNQVDMQQQAHYALSKWKTKLVLLSVCQKWRELAAPSVHDTSFVSCTIIRRSKAKGGSTWPYFSDLSWFDRRVEKYAVMSNLDIVDTDNSSNVAPGSLQIFVEASVNPIYSLRGIVDKLRAHRQLLKDVKRLELFTVNRSVYSWNSDNANAVEADFIGKDITQVVPSVEYIEWQMANDAPVVLGLAQSLIKSYARQLRGFSYPQAGLTKVFGFSDKLTYACVNGGNAESGYLPPVWTDNLAVLDLNLVRDNIDWSSFQNTNGPGADLWFPSLRRLRLVALDTTLGNSNAKNTISAADGHPALSGFGYNVIAPKLETLTVVPSPLTHSFVASIYGVSTIANVNMILGSTNVHFKEFAIENARELFARYANIRLEEENRRRTDISKIEYMNNIFSIRELAKYSKVNMGCFGTTPLREMDIRWKYLSEIALTGRIHVSDVGRLVAHGLETLETISVDGLIQPKSADEMTVDSPIQQSNVRAVRFTVDDELTTENEAYEIKACLDALFPEAQVHMGQKIIARR